MQKSLWIFFIFLGLLSCKNTDEKPKVANADLQMYEASEMTILMRQMYEVNKVVKNQIINKDSLLDFPDEFKKIHTAVLTDPSERDDEFDILATSFIDLQKETLSINSDSIIYNYNKSINTCIKCHETRCTGPIPKIKKLLIK
ncbi:MAG: hypothetical protein KAH67_06060 [Flavobacteriaceae bacterium]|nr:hypothetical protein [Flavobacteriaceae bacterium]